MKSGQNISEAEIERLLSLSRKAQSSSDEDRFGTGKAASVSWKEVFLGKSSHAN
jgi:hypothetical protein